MNDAISIPDRDARARIATPLAVDLDGTLLNTDTLYETIAANLFRRPLKTLAALASIVRGRAALKARLCDVGLPDAGTLPRNEAFIDYLRAEKAHGRTLHLATAADSRIARAVGESIGVFDSIEGSAADGNLKGDAKRAALEARFPEGFAYAGDSRADLAVWRGAKAAIFVNAAPSVVDAAEAAGAAREAVFPRPRRAGVKVWLKALRIHQWTKNLLIFAPLILAHLYNDLRSIALAADAWLIMGVAASGTYIINDLADLAADRRHRTKQNRPFACGAIPVRDGLVIAPLMIALALVAAFLTSPPFAGLLVVYLATTLGYSLGLKRVAMLDVFILGALYSLRVLMGVAVLGIFLSPWLIAFSFFFFFAMSLAKRHVELVSASDPRSTALVAGRGYAPADAPLTLALGTSMTAASILVLVLYLTEEAFISGAYQRPDFLWAAPAIVLIWTQRIWLLANRGQLDDDPVAFAVKDRTSIVLGFILLLFFAAAVV